MNEEFVGRKLRQARIYQGLSMQGLGESVAVSRQYIQQVECDITAPAADTQAALADVLGVEESFFYENDIPSSLGEFHFRKKRTTSETLTSQANEQGLFFGKLISYLDEKVHLPKLNFPPVRKEVESKTESNKAQDHQPIPAYEIEQKAEDLRTFWGLGLKSPISNMTLVLENAGAVVSYFEDVSDKIDACSASGIHPVIIRNKAKVPPARMRFDLGHELGHLAMHGGETTGDVQTESEANRFAGAFLIPKSIFFSEFGFLARTTNWQLLRELKKVWKVSIAAILHRASDLGIMSPAQYRLSCIQYNKGIKQPDKSEVDDTLIPEEKPEALDVALHHLCKKNELHYLPSDLNVKYKFLKKILGDTDLTEADFIPPSNDNVVRFCDLQ